MPTTLGNTHFHLYSRIKTGIASLDYIMGGGLPEHQMYVIEGDPGAGKTTLALQFLLEGARSGVPCFYVTLSETARDLREVAGSHGWNLDGIDLLELDTLADRFGE
jgi:circadian clock protein KaiC